MDVPSGVVTEIRFKTNVVVDNGGGVVATSETAVGFNVDVGTSDGSATEQSSGGSDSCQGGFKHDRNKYVLLGRS